MRYLLDTNTRIQVMRGLPSAVAALASHAPVEIAMSLITCYELYTGVEKCADPSRERTKVDALVNATNLIGFEIAAAVEAARIRANLESRGEMIGPYDVLIAGQALSLGLVLVTNNTSEYARISNLVLEDWQQTMP